MGTRLEFQTLLEGLQDGVSVYFQPPSNVQMSYPAIVYNRDYLVSEFADNIPYNNAIRYQLTVIDSDPDSLIPGKIASLPLMKYVRHYTVLNLNHDIFEVYF